MGSNKPESIRSVGLAKWLNSRYSHKGGYDVYKEMRDAGAKHNEIALHFDVNQRTVSDWKANE